MSRSTLDGPARSKVQSLALALDRDDSTLIKQRWDQLCSMLRKRRNDHAIKKLLTDEQAARLTRMTSFKA